MKLKLKNSYKLLAILTFALLTNCSKDNFENPDHEHSKIVTKTLIGQEANLIASKLKQLLPVTNTNPKSLFQNQEFSTSVGTIDYSRVAVIEEPDGTKKYAFNIVDANIDDNKFSNLILKEVGSYSTVKIAEYVMNTDFATNYYAGQEQITNFRGTLNQTVVTNNNPCNPDDSSTPINGSSTGIGGSGGTGGSNGTGSSSSGSNGSSSGGGSGGGGGMVVSCNDCGRGYGSIRAWQNGICATYDVTVYITFAEPVTVADPNPCDDNGTLPVITMSDNDIMLRNFFRNDLSYEQRMFLIANQSINNSVNNYLLENSIDAVLNTDTINFIKEIINLARNETNQSDANNLVGLALVIQDNNNIVFNDDFHSQIDQFVDLDLTNPSTTIAPNLFGVRIYLNYRKLRQLNPEWSQSKCIWESTKEIIHLGLDAFGLIPVVGEVADLTNGLLYLIEGDNLNATLSVASAVPIAGWGATGAKFAIKVKTAYATGIKVKLVWKVLADGSIYFGTNGTCRAQLRKALGMVVGNANQAHHIIPLNLQTNDIVQKAFKSAEAFHLNEALNGIYLSTLVHSGSHGAYDDLIEGYLNAVPANATPTQCFNTVNEIINKVRTAIANNPTIPINQLNF